MPENIPQITLEEKSLWSKLTYPELAKEVLSKYISSEEIPREDLNKIIDKAVNRLLGSNDDESGWEYVEFLTNFRP